MRVCKYESMQVCLNSALFKVRGKLIVCTLCKAFFPTCQIGNMVTKRAKIMPIHIEVKVQRLCMFALRHFYRAPLCQAYEKLGMCLSHSFLKEDLLSK